MKAFLEDGRNNILKHPAGITMVNESDYVYEIDENKLFNLTKKPEKSELPETTTWEGIMSILANTTYPMLIVSENKYFYRKQF